MVLSHKFNIVLDLIYHHHVDRKNYNSYKTRRNWCI